MTDKTDLSFCQLDFPVQPVKWCRIQNLRSVILFCHPFKKRNIAAFLGKLEKDDLWLHYFFKTMVCCFIT